MVYVDGRKHGNVCTYMYSTSNYENHENITYSLEVLTGD